MKNSDFKDSRLLEAFDFIDQKYIAEVADSLKFEKAAPMPAKGFNRRTWRHIAALAACVLLLGAVIPMMTYLLRNFGDIASWFPEDTTEESNPLTEPETPPEETTTLPPETTEEETTAEPETTACTHPNLTVSENMPTCTESATIQSYCSDCGYSDSKVLPPLGHDFVNGICTRCGATEENYVSIGLEYKAFGDYAVLVGIGTCTDPDIVIASEFQGLPVTEIWHEAFVGVKGMRSVKIPEGVKYIESHAFENCTDLREVYLPASLENVVGSLMTHGFVGCPAIETIEIAEGGKKYYSTGNCLIERETGTLVFGCGKSAIPADGSIKAIGEYAFNGCRNLVSLALPEGVIHIRTGAFSGCEALRTLTLPNSLVTIRQNAFENCTSLSSLTLPESVTEIYNGAFRGCSKLKSVTLPSSLTFIDSEAFLGTAIESIAIPAKIKELGAVFSECVNLTSVTLPEGFESFVGHTFAGCTSLKSINLPKSLKNIGMNTFYGCTALSDIQFAGTVAQWKSISKQEHWNEGAAFTVIHCSDGDVETIEYDGSVGLKYSISGNATIGYYMTLDGIGTCTDVDIVVASYYNGYPVKVIDNNAFNGQTHIKSIRLSDTVEIISYGAFRGCSSLESLYISASLKRIDSHVFWDCGNITKIEIDPNNEVFEGKNCIIEKSRKALVLGCRTTVIPSDGSVTRIDGLAFKDVIGLTSITIPEGVTLLSEDAFSGCPDLKSIHFSSTVDSFDLVSVMGCDALEVITVDPKNPRFYSSGNCVIEKATGTLLLGCGKSVIPNDGSIKKIGYYAFGGSNSLVSIVVPEGVTYIDGYAFASCESLKSVYLPDSLITLGYGVFYNSSALETVRIGNNLETIGSSVFDGCSKLNNLSFPKTLKRMGEMVFMECKSLTSVSFEGTGAEWNAIEKLELWNAGAGFTTVKCSDGVLELYEYDGSRGLQYVQYGSYAQLAGIGTCTDKDIVIASTYNGVPVVIIEPGVFKNNKNIRSVSIPNKVHYIGEDAFAFCTALESVVMPEKLKTLGSGAFNGCTSLKSINIPSGINKIDAYAFSECESLSEIVIPEGVTVIGSEAFYLCKNLQKVTLPSTLEWIQDWAFADCESLETVRIPNSVTQISIRAFSDCKNLSSLTLGKGVELIEESAFENCTSLGYVKFPKSLRLLANDAFAGCTSLTSVHYAGTIQEWNSVDSTGRDYGNSHVWYEGVPAASVHCTDGDVIIGG